MTQYFIGLMSGTSIDGIDAALVDFTKQPRLVASHNHKIPAPLERQLASLCNPQETVNEIDLLGEIDRLTGILFADAVRALLDKADIPAEQIVAIGSHGQTIRHRPDQAQPFTLQIGDPNQIVTRTGITTVADFRRRDMALGGQGAPFAPAFHAAVFHHPEKTRVIVNLGGIANITLLPPTGDVTGFDTGPANGLMDLWIREHKNADFDRDGNWARTGTVHPGLLQALLEDEYFAKPAPKSTGREHFSRAWLQRCLDSFEPLKPVDVQRTLLELTVRSCGQAIAAQAPSGDCYLCGGGAHNRYLVEQLARYLPDWHLDSTEALGVAPDWVEAITFAWLAKRTLEGLPGNLPSVTGARKSAIMGAIYSQ